MENLIKIVSDSSSDFLDLDGVEFASAPLKIVNDEKEYVDDAHLDVNMMVNELLAYKGKITTACPSPGDWLNAFGDAKYIIGVAISSKLSGSFNSLKLAKQIYEGDHNDRHVFIVDSNNAGPGMQLIIYKIRELILQGKPFEEICEYIEGYVKHCGIVFMLSSVHNFANNGRISPLIEKAIKLLSIKVVCRGSLDGKIEIVSKARGDKKGLPCMLRHIEEEGCTGQRIIIGHVYSQERAQAIEDMLKQAYPNAEISMYQLRGLCSFYAELGGLLVAFERDPKE